MKQKKSIVIFLSSLFGHSQIYQDACKQLVETLIANNIRIIYGGGRLGLMGVLADHALKLNADIVGIIPTVLYEKEVHLDLPELHVVTSMQERRAMMAEMSDACIMLPGGLGTLEEFFEYYNATKMGLHQKHCGLLNINHYYQHLLALLHASVNEGFLRQSDFDLLQVAEQPEELIGKLFVNLSDIAGWPGNVALDSAQAP